MSLLPRVGDLVSQGRDGGRQREVEGKGRGGKEGRTEGRWERERKEGWKKGRKEGGKG